MRKYLALFLLTAFSPPSHAAGAGVAYHATGPYQSGAAMIVAPSGGMYVYTSKVDADSRNRVRFMLGTPIRQDFDLFSAQEEAALWNTENQEQIKVAVAASVKVKRARRRHLAIVQKATRPVVDWPKVVLMGQSTCVPSLALANTADWKSHLLCWNPGVNNVEAIPNS